MVNITYKNLTLNDCHPKMLTKFNRYQETGPWWQKINGEWVLKDDDIFIDDWDDARKADEIKDYINVIKNGGTVIGAYIDDDLIGVAVVPNRFWGVGNDYLQLCGMHVSLEHRGTGIGKELFKMSCIAAKKMGAKKLYMSAHPSKETQAFYFAMGCRDAKEVVQELIDNEPYDKHLEYDLQLTPHEII